MESVWWVMKALWDKGLVYQGVRVMPFSWRLSTPLSNFEANLDYREVDDPAITVRMPIDGGLDGQDASLLVWTTTPWTLPSNLAVAVGDDIDYVRGKRAGDDGIYVVAAARAASVLGKEHEVLSTLKGRDLVGKTYTPLFTYFADEKARGAFCVIASGHVTTEDGTGLVHMAPAYGEDDFNACAKVGIAPIDPVDEEGRFTARVPDFAGHVVKDADPEIIQRLKAMGRLFKNERVRHSYPFCWRSGTPLIYKTVPVWFVKVEQIRERMSANNDTIHWVPDAVGSKRFGNWLGEARDWAISRNRFWGTPLPIWQCTNDACKRQDCIGSVEELKTRAKDSLGDDDVTDIHPHKIDHLTFTCGACAGVMRRIPEVFDCWFESGSMPYAQLHYPFENARTFDAGFPAQFIAEGLDQTRGWFYTLLVLSTALFDKSPFKNVIVNGLVLAEDGSKMSKSKKNYPDPTAVLDEHGADALRAYLINSPVVRAEPLRFAETGVREVVRSVLLPLANAWSFFVQYANVDGFDPTRDVVGAPPVAERPELDRWILSVKESLVRDVNEQMEGYYLYKVIPPLMGFIDHLTNWYIRRSRRRFWKSADAPENKRDKASAYATLYEVLVSFSQLMAPVLPFMTEAMYQNLVKEPGVAGAHDSVHLCDYPLVDETRVDRALERAMADARTVVSLGRTLRVTHDIKTRQPLSRATVVTHDAAARAAIASHKELIVDELNVKELVVLADDADLATLSFKANFKTLGKRMGKRMKEAATAIEAFTRDEWNRLHAGESVTVCDEAIVLDDVLVTRAPRDGVILASEGAITVALDTALDDALKNEGLVRELVSKLQRSRKDAGLAVTDRVRIALTCSEPALVAAARAQSAHIADEVLAVVLTIDEGAVDASAVDVEGHRVAVRLERVG